MDTSIIIRVKNEKENLKKLFTILKNQTYQNFEIIIVDNQSTDGSDRVIFNYFPKNRIHVVKLSRFSYPKACNLGAERAKGKYLVYLSAHSYPISNLWLQNGLSNFKKEKVAGVFAYPIPGPESTIWEKIFFGIPNSLRRNKKGDLGNTNSIIKKDFWEKHKFDEDLITSEDLEWSMHYKRKGYEIVNDPKFSVYHSHGLNLLGIFKEKLKWENSRSLIDAKFKAANN